MKTQRIIMKIRTNYSKSSFPNSTINHHQHSMTSWARFHQPTATVSKSTTNCRALMMINSPERHKLIENNIARPVPAKERERTTTTPTTRNFIPIACQHSSSRCSSSSAHLVWSPGSNRLITARSELWLTVCGDHSEFGFHENRKSPQNGRIFSRKFSTENQKQQQQQRGDGKSEEIREKQDNSGQKQQQQQQQPRVTLFDCCRSEGSGAGDDHDHVSSAEKPPQPAEQPVYWSFVSKQNKTNQTRGHNYHNLNSRRELIGSRASDGNYLSRQQPISSDTTTNEGQRRRSQLLNLRENHERIIWRAARDYQQTDHYDHSLFGLDAHMDQAVARHQREAMLYNQDRHLKDEQAKKVAPNLKQSPVSIMSLNPTYVLNNKPLVIEYPATVENLRLNNTGFSWEVKLPYQISMTTSLYGAHLNTAHRYRLDQFHCHWGDSNEQGSEHSVDNHFYSAELHFVHYNMEKYHTFSKAARHSDGLVVLSVFVDAHEDHHNHAELEKIVNHLKQIQLKGEHSIIKQAVRIENLLPANRSYWSYQGSLTTPPYLESVTWFILKQPIKCSQVQINKFRNIKSSLRHDEGVFIKSNHRRTQPLNGRTIVTFDEVTGTTGAAAATATKSSTASAGPTSRGILRST